MNIFSCSLFFVPDTVTAPRPLSQRMLILELIEGEIMRRTNLLVHINRREQVAYDEGKEIASALSPGQNLYLDDGIRTVATRLFHIRSSQRENLSYVALLRQIKTLFEFTQTIEKTVLDPLVAQLFTRADHLKNHRLLLTSLFQCGFISNVEQHARLTLIVDPDDSALEQQTRNVKIDLLIENLFFNKARHGGSSTKPEYPRPPHQ